MIRPRAVWGTLRPVEVVQADRAVRAAMAGELCSLT